MSNDRNERSERRRDHLSVVADTTPRAVPDRHGSARPRTIGRLIAQTALIADSAVSRRESDVEAGGPRRSGRLLGRFR